MRIVDSFDDKKSTFRGTRKECDVFMKKTIFLILLICLSFYISGCDDKCKLKIEDSEYIVSKPKQTRFVAGDNIEIKTIILDDLDIKNH